MTSPRIRTAVAGTALLALAALSACGSNASGTGALSDAGTASTGPVGIASSGSPAALPSGGSTATTPAHGTTTHTATPPSFPNTAQAYAQKAVNAYAHGQTALVKDYSNAGGVTSFQHLGHADTHWTFHASRPNGSDTDCLFDNDNGDRITVTLDPTMLGKPHAVTTAFIDRTEFGNSADGAVGALIQAWGDGDLPRVGAIGTAGTESSLSARTAPPSWTLSDTPLSDGGVDYTVVSASTPDGTLTFRVKNSAIGHAHAVSLQSG